MHRNQLANNRTIATDKGFVCIVPVLFRKALSGFGKEQFAFIMHLLCIRNRDNIIYGTMEGLASQSSISTNTVSSTIKELMEKDFIRRVGIRCLMINPSIVYSAGESKHRQLLGRYYGLTSDSKKKNDSHDITDDERDRFQKVWIGKLIEASCGLGQKQVQFLLFMLTAVGHDGCLYGTREELAKRSKVSRETVRDTIKLLKERDFLVRCGNGLLMINPDIISEDKTENRCNRVLAYRYMKHHTELTDNCDKYRKE